jgi:hypothetical protein
MHGFGPNNDFSTEHESTTGTVTCSEVSIVLGRSQPATASTLTEPNQPETTINMRHTNLFYPIAFRLARRPTASSFVVKGFKRPWHCWRCSTSL